MAHAPRRRYLQFGLSTLLLLMLGCGVSAWCFNALMLAPYRQEQTIIAEIRREGGGVTTEALGPEWLDWFDSQYSQRAVTVHLVGASVSDELLGRLHSLKYLRKVWLIETATSPEATRQLQTARPQLEIHVVQGFPIQSTSERKR
jgi:hypothetical protein